LPLCSRRRTRRPPARVQRLQASRVARASHQRHSALSCPPDVCEGPARAFVPSGGARPSPSRRRAAPGTGCRRQGATARTGRRQGESQEVLLPVGLALRRNVVGQRRALATGFASPTLRRSGLLQGCRQPVSQASRSCTSKLKEA
jgi:hypothetical protein